MSEKNSFLFKPLDALDEFGKLVEHADKRGTVSVYGIDDSQRIHIVASVWRKKQRPMLFVCSNAVTAQKVTEDLNSMIGGAKLFPARDTTFLKSAAASRELTLARVEAEGDLLTGKVNVLVATVDALQNRMMPRGRFESAIIKIHTSDIMEPKELAEKLAASGYDRCDTVEAHGQFSVRGGIVDVFPVGSSSAFRIEFFDDEIDSIRNFDVMTQRSTDMCGEAVIYPACEILFTAEEARAAADRIEKLTAGAKANRNESQRKLEQDFDLIPFEKFFTSGDDDGMEEMPSIFDIESDEPEEDDGHTEIIETVLPKSGVRSFKPVVDALRTGRSFEGKEALVQFLCEDNTDVLSYFDEPVIFLDQPERIREHTDNKALEFQEIFKAALERGEAINEQGELLISYDKLLVSISRRSVVTLNAFARTMQDIKPSALLKFDGVGATSYQGNIKELARDIKQKCSDGWTVCLLAGGKARSMRLEKALTEQDYYAYVPDEMPESVEPGRACILPISFGRGFLYPEIKFMVVCEGDIFGVGKQRTMRPAGSTNQMDAFTDLKVGDYVVHENHGIGQYMGTVRLASEGTYRDYLHIRYQGADKLYVPTDQMDRIQKYIGSEGEAPKINKLSGGEWQKQKARVRASIREIAGDLIKLYAQRQTVRGHAFGTDTVWQHEFEDAFPFEETADQLIAIEDIKRDMEKDTVMDRLLCGDVGYGKTEVALRAIFKCVMDGKQAALLAPTTILVQQHYATMMNRFHGYPIEIDTLSRFKTAAEQKDVLKKLKEGGLDVVIGTHKLLAKEVEFKNLGLLVVDEEQRFGVSHKEAIKQLKQSIDVLTLSATPIPRTLHMSMVGIRDMSLLRTPPQERYPVQTYVVEYSDGLVRDAILREMGRGGQTYVLHNRVQTIDLMYNRLKKLVPEARIAVGHGQMREHALEDVMLDFYEGKFDVLLCTTIIEAGLDVPRANTLIVCESDRFGLAQLYQLRGRVGRSNRLAYAYLTVNPNKVLTDDAEKRLSAIREFTEFGSGFRVAMRDLEIRGTGNLLGAEQSGHMASVGYDLYVKMIDEAVREMRGDVSKGDIDTRVEIKADAYLPKEYINSDLTRVEVYKKIAAIEDKNTRDDLIDELIDRFGDPTRPVMNLIEIAHLKGICHKLGIDLITSNESRLIMRFSGAAELDPVKLLSVLKKHEKCLRLMAGTTPSIVYFDMNATVETLLKKAVPLMEELLAEVSDVKE